MLQRQIQLDFLGSLQFDTQTDGARLKGRSPNPRPCSNLLCQGWASSYWVWESSICEGGLFCNHLITQGFFFWRRWCYRVPESLYRLHEPLANAAVLIILEGKFCLLEYQLHSQMQIGISGDVKILPSSGSWWWWWFLFFYTIYSGCLG